LILCRDSFDDLNPELVWEHVRFFRENKDALDKSDGFTKLLSETLLLPKKNVLSSIPFFISHW